MAHTCPEAYMPLGEAFEETLSLLENRESFVGLIEEAKDSEESDQHFIEYDGLARRVERIMRDALADGRLPMFIRTAQGTIERLVEREEWRQAAFGIPNIGSVADPITNPGVDTDGRMVLVRVDEFREWLTGERHKINPFRSGAPGKPSAIRVVENEHKRRLDGGEAAPSVKEEAVYLKAWLDRTYPDAPRTTAKTIENRIRVAHREHRLTASSSNC